MSEGISRVPEGTNKRPASNTAAATSDFPTLVLDNGAYTMKVGLAKAEKPRIVPNCISKARSERRRPFVGDQLEDCRDTSGLFFILPFQKGYMVNGDLEKTIWDYTFGKDCLNIEPTEMNILVTEPQYNFQFLQEVTCELLFEEYEFNAVSRANASLLADYKYASEHPEAICTLVVDCGYSFTHIVPFVNGQKITEAIRRIDVGGKALTNCLKEVVSYRQLHVLDETYLMNQVKEDLCFVSTNLSEDMITAKKKFPANNIVREYVLPDYSTIKRGFVRPIETTGSKAVEGEQILRMNNERFTIPEILFFPSDVGISQMGITECIMEVISTFPETMQPHFLKNIVVVGGSASFPGMQERIFSDIRSSSDVTFEVNVTVPSNPTTYAWEGGCKFSEDPEFSKFLITRSTYNEHGISAFSKICDV